MLNKLVISALTILTLFIFSATAYSQFVAKYAINENYPGLFTDRAQAVYHVNTNETTDYTSAGYSTANYLAVVSSSRKTVKYRKYIRPSREESEVFLAPMDPPVISSKTSIGVPPFGYKYYTKNTNAPLRDFRADIWLTHQYTSASAKNNVVYNNKTGAFYINPVGR